MSALPSHFPDDRLAAALRSGSDVEAICSAAGASREEFLAARTDFFARRLARFDQRLSCAVTGPVEIIRDKWGIPRISAAATPDLYFGIGFAMAQDRLWQMDRLRRRALGRQAEVLGPRYVQADLAHRLVDIPAISLAEVDRIDEATLALLTAFVAGINRGIEAFGDLLPVEFAILGYEPEPFTVRDVIATLRGMWWSLNGRLETIVVAEAARLIPEPYRADYLTPECPDVRIVPDHALHPALRNSPGSTAERGAGQGDGMGSNNWAVAATKTGTGHALLSTDPHQPFWLPSSWYEYAVAGPDDHAAGAGHPGVPGFWWGSNGDIAWGLTNNAASTRDLYVETLHPSDPALYRDETGWKRLTEEDVTIAVAGGDPESFVRRSTVRGPLVNAVLPSIDPSGDPPLSLRWVGQEHLDDIRALINVGRARNAKSFRAALRDWSVAVFNFAWADRDGQVGYQCAGRIPIRGRAMAGYRDAQNPDDVWRGYVPFEELPRWTNPEQGYVASANNRAASDAYRHPLTGAWAAGWRHSRINHVIRNSDAFTVDDARALQLDVHSARAAALSPSIVAHLAEATDPDAALLRDTLAGWNAEYTLESTAPVLFESFMAFYQQRIAAQWLPPAIVSIAQARGRIAERSLTEPGHSPFAEQLTVVIAAVAAEAVATVRARHGEDISGWRWGVVHQVHLRHPLSNPLTSDLLDIGPAPVAGCFETVCNTGTGAPPGCEAVSGVEYRLIADFANPDRVLAVQNAGNSGQPGSPHYADQFHPWIAGDYHELPLSAGRSTSVSRTIRLDSE